jgi:hypothetical protein
LALRRVLVSALARVSEMLNLKISALGHNRRTLTPVATLWPSFLPRGPCRAQCTCRTRSHRKNNPT